MTLKNLTEEFDHCIKCGLCLATCPVCKELLLEKYTPRGKIQLAKQYSQGSLDLSDHYWDIFAKCLLCCACSVTCPSGVDLRRVLFSTREEIASKRGLHPRMKRFVESLVAHHNISGSDNAERGEWREFLDDLPAHMYQKEKAEIVYFVGCVASFFPIVQPIPEHLVQILATVKADFTILAEEEWCCGFPLIGAGTPEAMREVIDHNLEKVKALKAKTVVFSCPSCYNTWKEYYKTDLELLHSTQFLEKLIDEGAIHLGAINTVVTYHDPCDLGRNSSVYDAPRRILQAIPGLTLVELENSQAQSVCCGGGGNLEMIDSDLTGNLAQKKIAEIQKIGVNTVVTACQQCVRIIKAKARERKINLNVLDIAELVLQAMSRD
ncbi:MAG: (Fe-S)-binding protein [Candidatus Hodarchaeales archaeon]|jgi:heterodisulfide reductase subunit D